MQVEYALCQIQKDRDSMASRTHRLEDGDPRLVIDVRTGDVLWTLDNLMEGGRQVVSGRPRKDRVDFYFLLENFLRDRHELPDPATLPNPALRLPTTNSVGRERPGGRTIKMENPNQRYAVASVEAFLTHPPAFHAVGNGSISLHLDFEFTPRGMYPTRLRQVHFGIQASYRVTSGVEVAQNRVVVTMSHPTYATIYEDLQNVQD